MSEHLTAGITHREGKSLKGQQLCQSLSGHPADVSGRLSAGMWLQTVAFRGFQQAHYLRSAFSRHTTAVRAVRQRAAVLPGAGRGGYGSASRDNIHSNYDSVNEQSGIFAGRGYFDITVGNHTQLDGAVIASTAPADRNSLDTGTLGWSDIHNRADHKASYTGISLSGGSGMSASQMVASNAIAGAANALTGMSGSSGHAEGTTSSAISGGNLIIRDKESQKQDIAGLSRDPENANGSIAPIFDRERTKRLQEAQVISQISGQMSNIVMTYGETEAMKAAGKSIPA